MKLINIEASRVVSLALLRQTKGQPFALDVLNGIIQRYNFQHFPEKVPELSNESTTLSIGNFNGNQIDDLTAYSDGLAAGARAGTEVVDSFLDDVYEFVATRFAVHKVEMPRETRHYESGIVIELDRRIVSKFDFLSGLCKDVADFRNGYGLGDSEYTFGGVIAETETTLAGRRIMAFKLERRALTPFDANYWFSSAPLRTADHLKVLQNLEKQLL